MVDGLFKAVAGAKFKIATDPAAHVDRFEPPVCFCARREDPRKQQQHVSIAVDHLLFTLVGLFWLSPSRRQFKQGGTPLFCFG